MKQQMKRMGAGAMGLYAACGLAASASAGVIINPQTPTDASYRIVAYTGQAAPGGGVWTGLGIPSMSNTGRVAFVGAVQGLFAQTGIWSEGHTGAGNLQPVVRQFQNVPSLVPMTFGEFESIFHSPQMNESGDIVFGAPLVGNTLTESSDNGILRMVDGVLESVALPFWPAPGGGLFESISNLPSINNHGDVVFHSSLVGNGVGASNDSGVYHTGDGPTERVFREGDAIASLPNAFMGGATTFLERINDDGVIGIHNYYLDNGQSRWSIWCTEPEGVSASDLIAQEDDPSPLGPDYSGGLYSFGEYSINNAGDVMFVQSAELGTPSERAIWLEQNGVESAMGYWGMIGPFGMEFRLVSSYSNSINGDGRVVFRSSFDAIGFQAGDTGVFYRDGVGPVQIVAIAGQDAPGMPAGVDFDHGDNFSSVCLNNVGRVAYTARMDGPGITDDNNVALWISRESSGDADLVIYEGQIMSVGGQLRTIESFIYRVGAGPESGRRAAFNDNGQVALNVQFTDDTSAIIVATVAALCAGDLNGDGIVDGADLATLLAGWGACGDEFCAADLNLDGQVNGADLASLLAAWGSCP